MLFELSWVFFTILAILTPVTRAFFIHLRLSIKVIILSLFVLEVLALSLHLKTAHHFILCYHE